MTLSERRNKVAQQREVLLQLKLERAKNAAEEILNSDQFKMSAIAMPESSMAIDALVNSAVRSITDPVAEYMDTLKAKGFRIGEIRSLTHNLYRLYCNGNNENDANLIFENMVGPVAQYVAMHQELYNTFDPESLRES